MIGQRSLVWVFLMMVVASAAFAEKKAWASKPYPAPRIAGRFLATDGARLLILRSQGNPQTFSGVLQSTCMLPAQSKTSQNQPLNLSSIPIGSAMTAFLGRTPAEKPGRATDNVILAVRFDQVPAGSTLPPGVVIPCFKAGR